MPVGFPPNSGSGLPNVYNFNPSSNLLHWRKALAQVQAGIANTRLLCLGDSTTFGLGANGTIGTGDEITLSYPTQLSNFLNTAGINAHQNSWTGNGYASFNRAGACDARLTAGTGWADTGGTYFTVGGSFLEGIGGSAGLLAFTPKTNTDTINFIYNGGLTGNYKINANGANAQTFSQNISANMNMQNAVFPLGANTYNIDISSDAAAAIFASGMECYDSSKFWVSVMNGGASSALSANFVFGPANTWYPGTVIGNLIKPSLTILNVGINDWAQNVALATYLSDMQTLISYCKWGTATTGGDCILMTPVPSDSGTAPLSRQAAFIAGMYGLATSNNIPLIDINARWVSESISNTLGLYCPGNTVHPNGTGYGDQARAIGKVLVNV